MSDYQQVIATLRLSYNREKAEKRNQTDKDSWKVTEPFFDIVSFKTIPLQGNIWHFQSMILHRKE